MIKLLCPHCNNHEHILFFDCDIIKLNYNTNGLIQCDSCNKLFTYKLNIEINKE